MRGHFMECRYGSDFMTLDDRKDAIDYFADMKINTLIIGLYGCWPRQYDGIKLMNAPNIRQFVNTKICD